MTRPSPHASSKNQRLRTIVSVWIFTCSLLSPLGTRAKGQESNLYLRQLSDKSEKLDIRENAARTLGRLGSANEAAAEALSEVLQSKNEAGRLRRAALSALSAIGQQTGEADEVGDLLLEMIGDQHPSLDPIRAAAARELGKVLQNAKGSELAQRAVPVLVLALRKPDPDPMVRANAAWALSQIGEAVGESRNAGTSETVKALIKAVQVTQVNVGQAAAQSLIKMYKAAVPELKLKLTDNDDANFKWTIAWILGEIGHDAKDAVPSLTHVVKNNEEDPNVRGAAAWAIGRIGPDAKAGTSNFSDTVSALVSALGNADDDPNVRSNAAWALGRMGPEVKPEKARFPDAVSAALWGALNDTDPDIRRNVVWALGQIRPEPKAAASALISALREPQPEADPKVRVEIAVALGQIGPAGDAATTVRALIGMLKDQEATVQSAAALALAQIGAESQGAIGPLLELSHTPRMPRGHLEGRENSNARRSAAEAVAKIADALDVTNSIDAIEELTKAGARLKENGYRGYAEQVARDVRDLQDFRLYKRIHGVLDWFLRYRAPVLVICAYILAWFLLYWKHPYWVFQINEALKPYTWFRLPKFLGGIPVSYLTLGGLLHYRPRVLDAWVAEHLIFAQEKFHRKLTVEQRQVHVELPALLNGKAIPALRAADLRVYFERKRICVLVCGEGGVGKTSLACQICKWAMSNDRRTRLSQRPMIAVLLEGDYFETNTKEKVLIEAVRIELRYLIDTPDTPSVELVESLLKSRRIVVVVDGFSEMKELKRKNIQLSDPQFSTYALVITSRLEERPVGMDTDIISPMRVQGGHLSTFMDAYLVQRRKKELFTDFEYVDDLSNFSRMVGERDIPVLFAKLYAEQMITAREAPVESRLPGSIPDLILEYLNELNRKVMQPKINDRVVHHVAKAIARECLEESCRPMPAMMGKIVKRLGGQTTAVEAQLVHLEKNLRVIQTIGAAQDRIRFTLDPLAEYLAALHVMTDLAQDEKRWRKFLAEIDLAPGAPAAITGFLTALRDCCVVKGPELGIPDFIVAEVGIRTGLSPRAGKLPVPKPPSRAPIVQAKSA